MCAKRNESANSYVLQGRGLNLMKQTNGQQKQPKIKINVQRNKADKQ